MSIEQSSVEHTSIEQSSIEQTGIELVPFSAAQVGEQGSATVEIIVDLWHRSLHGRLPFSPRLIEFVRTPVPDVDAAIGALAQLPGDEAVGFVLIRSEGPIGRLLALAVSPPYQSQGIGKTLLNWAENRLREQGCTLITTDGGPWGFLPGVPQEGTLDRNTADEEASTGKAAGKTMGKAMGKAESFTTAADFFVHRGYPLAPASAVDWARTINDYVPPAGLEQIPCRVSPASPSQLPAIERLLSGMEARLEETGAQGNEMVTELSSVTSFLKQGGRIADLMLLWTEAGLSGLCRLILADSIWPIERFYPYQLPKPWAAITPPLLTDELLTGEAVAENGMLVNSRGYTTALLDASLRRLHNIGVNGVVIRQRINPEDRSGTRGDIAEESILTELGFSVLRRYRVFHRSLG